MNAVSDTELVLDQAGLFTPEELALVASAELADVSETEAGLAALELRVREMARLVAEGYERERLLRRAAGADNQASALDRHADSLLDAMKQLSDLLAAGAAREVILRDAARSV